MWIWIWIWFVDSARCAFGLILPAFLPWACSRPTPTRPHAHTPTSAAERKLTGPGKNRGDEEGGREDAPADERCENIERLGAQTATIIGRYNAMEYLIGVHIVALDVLLVAIGWSIVGWIVQATF